MKNYRLVAVTGLACLALFSGFNLLFSSGIVGVTQKPNHVFFTPGCFCHADTSSVNVHTWIEGPDTLMAGEEGLYRIYVVKDSNVAAGFNVAAFFGSLGIVDSTETQLMQPTPDDSTELTHIHPKLAGGSDTIYWSFSYRAPMNGGILDTLYANGNSVDHTGDTAGDEWSFAPNFFVHVMPPNSVADATGPQSPRLKQNYPNPFNPSTTISFTLRHSSFAVLKVYDISGREVAAPLNGQLSAGGHAVVFDASGLAAGVYIYELTVNGGSTYREVRKMVLLK